MNEIVGVYEGIDDGLVVPIARVEDVIEVDGGAKDAKVGTLELGLGRSTKIGRGGSKGANKGEEGELHRFASR